MKQLSLVQDDFNFGHSNPACEGFIDSLKGVFNGTNDRKKSVQEIKNAKWPLKLHDLKKFLDRDLNNTYGNDGWVKKNLPQQSEIAKVPAMTLAFYDGKPITTPGKILEIAKGMVSVYKEIVQTEKPHTELRRQLIAKIKASSDKNTTAEQLWNQYSKQLSETAAARWLKKNKVTPAFGGVGNFDLGWPVGAKGGGKSGFDYPVGKKGDGQFQLPAQTNAKEYYIAISELFKMMEEVAAINDSQWILDWETAQLNYDTLKHGDEIYTLLYSDQSIEEVYDLGWYIEREFSRLVGALYVTMFDKHMVNRESSVGNEGFLDIFKKKDKDGFNNASSSLKVNLTHKSDLLNALVKNPGAFRLTGSTPKLALSIDGNAPSIDQLVSSLSQTLKSMADLNNKFKQDALSHARIAGPLISNFEKAMTAVMDNDGDVPQDELNKVMLPIIAAKSQLQRTYYNQFGNDQKLAEHWLGGNPFNMVRNRDGSWDDKSHGLKPLVIQMPKATDMSVIENLLKALAPHVMPNSYVFFDNDGPFDDELDVPSYEFDRPVRHLDEYMSAEQTAAIYTLYTFFDNTAGLHLDLCGYAERLLTAITTYIYTSVEEVK